MSGQPVMKTRVKLTRKSTAVAAMPVKPGKTYPLSVLDHAMAKHTLHLIFYYPRTTTASTGIVLERLKASLSDVLFQFPAVTGRLVRGGEDGNWVVKCNDAGVRVVEAEVEGMTVDEWLRSADASEERDLAYWEEMGDEPYIWSPLYIQLTSFKDGGVAIGLSCPHMFADPTCATLVMKAWSDAHRRACIATPPFFHPPGLRGRPNPNTSTPSAAFLQSKSTTPSSLPPPMSTATFRFSDQAIKTCLSKIASFSPSATPFDALAALFWWRASAAEKPQVLTLCTDFRKNMHAPLPHGFFGNALHFSAVEAEGGAGWGEMAEKVRKHLEGVEEEEYWSAVDWAEGRKDGRGKYGEAFQMYGPGLTAVRMDHHRFSYATVFDGKAPAHVSCLVGGEVGGEGVVVVMPHPEEGEGRTVVVTMPEDRTVEICRDENILGLGATLIFNGGR